MFDNLSSRFESILKKVRGKGRLTEADVDEVLSEIRAALLDADVNVGVVRTVVARIREAAIGAELSQALDPGQQVVKIVSQELTAMLGGETLKISYASKPPTVVLMAGLQGSGKTTSAAKLARWFKSQGRHPLLVGADLQRPAAVEQLRTLGKQIDVPVFSEPGDPVTTATRGLAEARRIGKDVLIVDTAGRLHIDAELIQQAADVRDVVKPRETLLVVDGLTGQDAVNVATEFDAKIGVTGVVLTRMDGDGRGGAALSMRAVTGKPIRFVGLGEQMDAIETFEPGRIAGRILGMGDIVALVEKAQATIEAEQAERMMKRFQKGRFNMNDLKMQLEQMLKMGGMESMMGMLPGMAKASKQMSAAGLDDTMLKRQIALINSMTKKERANPDLMQASRKKRVAAGAGLEVSELNRLLKQQKQMADMMKKMGKMGKGGALKQMMKGMMGKGGGMPDLNDPAALEEAAKAMGAKLPGNLPGLGGGMQLPGNLAGFGKKK